MHGREVINVGRVTSCVGCGSASLSVCHSAPARGTEYYLGPLSNLKRKVMRLDGRPNEIGKEKVIERDSVRFE